MSLILYNFEKLLIILENFYVKSFFSAGEICSQGSWPLAHSSERVRERDEQCAQVARIYTGAPVYA